MASIDKSKAASRSVAQSSASVASSVCCQAKAVLSASAQLTKQQFTTVSSDAMIKTYQNLSKDLAAYKAEPKQK